MSEEPGKEDLQPAAAAETAQKEKRKKKKKTNKPGRTLFFSSTKLLATNLCLGKKQKIQDLPLTPTPNPGLWEEVCFDVWEESWSLGCSFYWEQKGSGD